MLGIWIGFRSRNRNGEPFCASSKKYSRVAMHQMPPTSSFSNFLTIVAGNFDAADAEVAEQRLVDVALLVERHLTLSMTLRLPRSRIEDLTFSASSGRT